MDWNTITTLIVTSGVIATVIGFVLKKSFEKVLDLKIDQIKKKSAAEIQERKRREAVVFDKQFDVLKTCLALTYRARNTARDLVDRIERDEKDIPGHIDKMDQRMSLRNYSEAIIALLYDERALIPPKLFAMAHELKIALRNILYLRCNSLN